MIGTLLRITGYGGALNVTKVIEQLEARIEARDRWIERANVDSLYDELEIERHKGGLRQKNRDKQARFRERQREKAAEKRAADTEKQPDSSDRAGHDDAEDGAAADTAAG